MEPFKLGKMTYPSSSRSSHCRGVYFREPSAHGQAWRHIKRGPRRIWIMRMWIRAGGYVFLTPEIGYLSSL